MLYLDESGDHNLKRISPTYPLFVLGGVIIERAYVREVVEPRMRAFKRRFFGRDDIILHTVEMSKGRGEYSFLADRTIRTKFFAELNEMLAALEFKVVACVIKKRAHVQKYGANALDPYMYSLRILVERFCEELGDELDSGFICAEKRNPGLDRELLKAWERLITNGHGTGYTRSEVIDSHIVGFDLKDKKPNLAGMQLADLVITPIGRHVAQRPEKANEVQWSVVESKLRQSDEKYWGRGLIIRP